MFVLVRFYSKNFYSKYFLVTSVLKMNFRILLIVFIYARFLQILVKHLFSHHLLII